VLSFVTLCDKARREEDTCTPKQQKLANLVYNLIKNVCPVRISQTSCVLAVLFRLKTLEGLYNSFLQCLLTKRKCVLSRHNHLLTKKNCLPSKKNIFANQENYLTTRKHCLLTIKHCMPTTQHCLPTKNIFFFWLVCTFSLSAVSFSSIFHDMQ